MEVNKKLVKILLVIYVPLVHGVLLGVTDTSLATTHSPLFYVSGLISDWNQKHPGINQVVVLNIGNKSDLWENVIKIIPKDNPVVIADPSRCGSIEKRKAEFIIIATDVFDVSVLMKLLGGCVDEPFWISPSTKFIFLPLWSIVKQEISHIYSFIESVRRLNVALIFEEKVGGKKMTTRIRGFNMLRRKLLNLPLTTDVDVIFADKLRDLNKYNLKALATIQRPRLFMKNEKFYGYDVLFMEIAAKKQNANFSIGFFNATNIAEFQKAMFYGKADLCLNTMYKGGVVLSSEKYTKTFNTFDVDGFCALIPIRPRESFFNYLFVPYDAASWIFMLVSLIALAIVWIIFKQQSDSRTLSSVGRVIFRVIAGFLGQAFNFVTTRWFHVMVMQIFIFAVLILGNAYQSIIITLLTTSRNSTRITTVDEMTSGDYNYISDGFFYVRMTRDYPNSSITQRLQENKYVMLLEKFNYEATAANDTVLVVRCDFANDVFYSDNYKFTEGHISDFYYILPEKFLTTYETLTTARFSPFIDQLAETAARIFESGIKQHWKTLLHKLTDQIDLEQISIMKEEFLLKMGDLKYVFYLWFIGMSVALAAFVVELLCHKYRARIRKTWVMRMLRRLSWGERIRKREMLMMRRRARVEIEPFEMIQC